MHKNKESVLWQDFADRCKLSHEQVEQFKRYYQLIVEYNKRFNLTAITDLQEVLLYHFEDSIKLDNFIDLSSCSMLSDVGTGAGLPGIPLKILNPELPVMLVEVSEKKVDFLRLVIEQLGLSDIEVCSLDWRTFLRQTNYPVDVVCARASLRPDELTRMFKPSSSYKNARLVYWASAEWEIDEKEKLFFDREESYTVGQKNRRYIFFKN